MNLEPLIKWGKHILTLLGPPDKVLPVEIPFEPFIHQFSWLWQYIDSIERWQEMLEIIGITESFVRKPGIYQGCHLDLKSQLPSPTHFSKTSTLVWKFVPTLYLFP